MCASLLPLDKLDKGTVTGVLAHVVAFLMPPRLCLLRGEWEETSAGTRVSLDKDGGGGGGGMQRSPYGSADPRVKCIDPGRQRPLRTLPVR